MKKSIHFNWKTDDIFIPEHEKDLTLIALEQIKDQINFGNTNGGVSAQLYYDGSNEDIDGDGYIHYYGRWKIEEL